MESVSTSSAFDEASQAVVDYLARAIPLGTWSVTRYDGERQVYLSLAGTGHTLTAGDNVAWADTLCQYSTSGLAPSVVADAAGNPVYSATEPVRSGQVATFVGQPIRSSNGALFGTLCGFDETVHDEVTGQGALFTLLADLLGRVLDADLARAAAARDAALAHTRAETDPLTGTLNRRGWDRLLALYEERHQIFGDPCAVLVIDLDGLKQVNDSAGHDAGDALLRRTAGAISSVVRTDDVVARLGGDEFGVLAALTPGEAQTLVGRLDEALTASGVGASIGVADLEMRTGSLAAWKVADERMYAAKVTRKLSRQLCARGEFV